jgi:hypothetical protein
MVSGLIKGKDERVEREERVEFWQIKRRGLL